MKIIADAYAMLKLQWSALGQSADYGVAVLAKVKTQYPEVPFDFYSRKITPFAGNSTVEPCTRRRWPPD